MDSRGSLTMEIAIAAVLILLVSGIILISIEDATDKIVKLEETENMEILASEVVDNLINKPGMPDNWFEIKKGIPGLAVVNEDGQTIPNSVSYEKFIALGESYKKFVDERLFDSKIKTSMEIIPQKSSISSVKIGSGEDAGNVFGVNRLVKCDFYRKHVLRDFETPGKCNRNHDQKLYSCNYFKIFKENIKSSDYYLLVDDDVKYIASTTRIVKEKYWRQAPDVIYLNNEINFYDDESAIVFIHFDKPHANALLVSVPKNFNRENLEYDYFRTNECEFVLKAWY